MRLLRRRRQSALRPLWITSEMKSINGTAKTRPTSLSTNNALFMDFALATWRGNAQQDARKSLLSVPLAAARYITWKQFCVNAVALYWTINQPIKSF